MANSSSNGPLAHIYAEALYDAAQHAGELDRVLLEVQDVGRIFARNPRELRFFDSPVIGFDAKRKVIEQAFSAYSKITRNFLMVVVDRARAGAFSQIVDGFVRHAQQQAGIAPVEVRSALPLNDAARAQITAVLEKKLQRKVALEEKVRPDLLGGLVVIHGDRLWDASLSRALKEAVQKMGETRLKAVVRNGN